MTDRTLRTCIRDLLKLVKLRSVHIRRRCNEQWCEELRGLSGTRLLSRLKYIIWWTPLRVIATAYDRGILHGHRVIVCVCKELQRRGLEDVPCIRRLVDEGRSKYFIDKYKLFRNTLFQTRKNLKLFEIFEHQDLSKIFSKKGGY